MYNFYRYFRYVWNFVFKQLKNTTLHDVEISSNHNNNTIYYQDIIGFVFTQADSFQILRDDNSCATSIC